MVTQAFWQGKRVLLTGHTGFKGTWAALWLTAMGAKVTGISLPANTDFFGMLSPWTGLDEHLINIEDRTKLQTLLAEQMQAAPFDIVIHMAAQSLVRPSYKAPVETFATNVMGTLHLLEAVSQQTSPQVILVVTSDKVYQNLDIEQPFVEPDALGGDDPYSASKSCAELAVRSWRVSGLSAAESTLVTARAGNVIGGGDWSVDRLIPDLVRAWSQSEPLQLRYPQSTRPWQHVLDVLHGYFSYIEALAGDRREQQGQSLPSSLNFGPALDACLPAGEVIQRMQAAMGSNVPVLTDSSIQHLPEKSRLTLNTQLAQSTLAWRPALSIDQSIQWTADWYKAWHDGQAMRAFSLAQLAQYESLLS